MPSFAAGSVALTGGFEVAAPIGGAFPLFSPLGEKAWAPGWDPELLHPPGVAWAEGLVFRTRGGEVVWTVTHLDLNAHTVEYFRIEPGRYTVRVRVQCSAISARRTAVNVAYEFVGLSAAGNTEIASMTQEDYSRKMEQWAAWIRGHLEKGGS